MRYLLLSSALLLAGLLSVASAQTPTTPARTIKRTVYLDHLVLEELKNSNPDRYAQVRKAMASASESCQPNAARQWRITDAQPAGCSEMILKTSYPPKRQVAIPIGDTLYIALVTVRDAPALVKAEPGKVIPLDSSK